ncbi:ankyrin repeat and fibronectin type-III domain-containing protein 1 [Heterodontus francisci]|uniref:ankyrin repeat and fibronectin type-III domain-containing protein 1 n=1 Tax=Heterodontus francisci TaxID=7792 RepID=UPI00355C4EEE
MMQQMQNLHLCHTRKSCSPASPNAAKRLYRNLSDKFKGSHSSFDEAFLTAKSDKDRLRKSSLNFQCNEALFEAIEQHDFDAVQLLLNDCSLDEVDLNTPNSEGLLPLDIAVMTNNVAVARTLLKAGAKESPHFVNVESRAMHLNNLLEDAQDRVNELSSEGLSDGPGHDNTEKKQQLRAWEWRYRLYTQMKTEFEHARVPGTPTNVSLTVTGSTSLTVTFQEPLSTNPTLISRYKVEWSCLMDFSAQCEEITLENLKTLRCTIPGLITGQSYYMRVSAANMKGWGPPQASNPPFAIPSNWKELDGREPRYREQIEVLECLLKQVQVEHQNYNGRENSKPQSVSRKQSVSRSLKHLFHSSSKFVKTLKRGVYIAAIFYHKDNVLVTNEDQIPMVEIDNSYSNTLMQDFLWFTKLSCTWEEVRWLRQNLSASTSASSALQTRHKMLNAAAQLQTLLGTQNLGTVYYEPIKDRHGNVLLVTVRELESQYSFVNGKWIQICKFQSQRKSLSTLEEPTALDVLLITIQGVLSYQKGSQQRLNPGLYLGYLKLSSSVDQIKVLVSSRMSNMLCHIKVRDNSNLSREDWEWMQRLSDLELLSSVREPPILQTPLFWELQAAVKALLKYINLPLNQAKQFRVFTQEVLELSHNVSFLLLLPSSDSVCNPPGQANPYNHPSSFLYLPLQMFELVHFCCYREKFMNLYCRVSTLLELDSLITQQDLREAISDEEVLSAKGRHQEVSGYVQQLDGIWREVRWIMDALQYARYKHPAGGLPITWFISSLEEAPQEKNDSTSSHMDYLPSPSPSPENLRRKAVSDSQPCSDEECCSEVFLPTDSDYDSSDALSPRGLELLCSSPSEFRQQLGYVLSGSAPDVLQIHELQLREECEQSCSFRAASELATENSRSLTVGGMCKSSTEKASHPTDTRFFSKKGSSQHKIPRHQKYHNFNRNRWLCFHREAQSLSISEGAYTHRQGTELPPESAASTFPELACSPGSGEPRPGLLVDLCQQSSSEDEPGSWSLSFCGSQPSIAEAASASGTARETDCDELCDTQSSDIFSSVL